MATRPNERPIEVTVDGEAPETRRSHNTGTLDITTAAVGAVERNDPREYATNNNKMPTSRETFESLHQDLFELIDNAIDTHESSLTEEKKRKSGKRKPKAT